MTKCFLILAVLASAPAIADWQVDPAGSHLGFASVKNDLIAENHHFKRLTGGVDDTGLATIVVDLASVETMIPIRNERMQQMLFDVTGFPAAVIASKVDVDSFTSLAVGEIEEVTLDLAINLHGHEVRKSVPVKVTRSAAGTFDVTSLGPILVHASQFGLADGVESLRKVAGLQSIDLMVAVSFDLRLVRLAAGS